MTNHRCHPRPGTEEQVRSDTVIATCATCGGRVETFLIEDDDRGPRWSGWVAVINRNKPKAGAS